MLEGGDHGTTFGGALRVELLQVLAHAFLLVRGHRDVLLELLDVLVQHLEAVRDLGEPLVEHLAELVGQARDLHVGALHRLLELGDVGLVLLRAAPELDDRGRGLLAPVTDLVRGGPLRVKALVDRDDGVLELLHVLTVGGELLLDLLDRVVGGPALLPQAPAVYHSLEEVRTDRRWLTSRERPRGRW